MRRVYLDVVLIFSPAPLLQAPVGHREGVSSADEGKQPSPRGRQCCLGEEGPFNDAGTVCVCVADVGVGKTLDHHKFPPFTGPTVSSHLSPVPLSPKLLNPPPPSSIILWLSLNMSSLKGCVEWPRGSLQLTGCHQRRVRLHRPCRHQHAAARGHPAAHSRPLCRRVSLLFSLAEEGRHHPSQIDIENTHTGSLAAQ